MIADASVVLGDSAILLILGGNHVTGVLTWLTAYLNEIAVIVEVASVNKELALLFV